MKYVYDEFEKYHQRYTLVLFFTTLFLILALLIIYVLDKIDTHQEKKAEKLIKGENKKE